MARITIASLKSQLDAVNASFEQAHALLMAVSAERDAAQAALLALEEENLALLTERNNLRAAAAAHNTPSRRMAAHMPAWQQQRAEQMAAARALAMRVGRPVKVEVAGVAA